jgi:hypothetical protein
MNRIVRTALASVAAAVVVTGGGLGMAYATAPAPAHPQASSDPGRVAALNKEADDLLTRIAALEKQLASPPPVVTSPAPPWTRQELAERGATFGPASGAAPATRVGPATAAGYEHEARNGSESDD